MLVVDARAGLLPDDSAIAAQLRRAGEVGDRRGQQVGSAGRRPRRVHPARLRQAAADLGRARPRGRRPAGRGARGPAARRGDRGGAGASGSRSWGGRTSASRRCSTGFSARSAPSSRRSPAPRATRWTACSCAAKTATCSSTRPASGASGCSRRTSTTSAWCRREAIDRADVAILVLDAEDGLRDMDATIAGRIQDARRGVVICVNKWDVATTGRSSRRSSSRTSAII